MRDIIVIGGSAGSIGALRKIVAGLSGDLPAAVLVVIHISPNAPSALASILGRETGLRVKDARHGEQIARGCLYVATPDCHLMLDGDRIRLARGPRENRVRPSIDVLFRSAAVSVGPRAIGVVLSGALDDGTAGLWAIKDRGGVAVAQSPDDAEVPSMPLSALAHVEVNHVRPAADIAGLINKLALESAPAARAANDDMAEENRIALNQNDAMKRVFEMGTISANTCPECHGALIEIREGKVVRFRCHTGHGFSAQTLLGDTNDAIEQSLYNAIRATEERSFLLRTMAKEAVDRGESDVAAEHAAAAARDEETVVKIRELLPLSAADHGLRDATGR